MTKFSLLLFFMDIPHLIISLNTFVIIFLKMSFHKIMKRRGHKCYLKMIYVLDRKLQEKSRIPWPLLPQLELSFVSTAEAQSHNGLLQYLVFF